MLYSRQGARVIPNGRPATVTRAFFFVRALNREFARRDVHRSESHIYITVPFGNRTHCFVTRSFTNLNNTRDLNTCHINNCTTVLKRATRATLAALCQVQTVQTAVAHDNTHDKTLLFRCFVCRDNIALSNLDKTLEFD